MRVTLHFAVLYILVGYLCMCVGLSEVGIYRVAGVMRDLDELSKAFDTGDHVAGTHMQVYNTVLDSYVL